MPHLDKIRKLRSSARLNGDASQKLRSKKRRGFQQYRFQAIPQQSKIHHQNPIHWLPGDIPVMEFNGTLITDLSFQNETKTYQEVIIDDKWSKKVLIIHPELKKDQEIPPSNEFIESLQKSQDENLAKSGEKLQQFTLTYNKVIRKQSRKKPKGDARKKFYSKITAETEERQKHLFENHPCGLVRFRVKEHQNHMSEIIWTEDLLKWHNFTLDEFASLILNEGIPQLIPYENLADFPIKQNLVSNYFTLKKEGFKMIEKETVILMKDGFARKALCQMYYFLNYENNSFGIDMLACFISTGEPYVYSTSHKNEYINTDFVEKMKSQEKEVVDFLVQYYGRKPEQKYINMERVCKIKEIDPNLDEYDNPDKKEENP